MSKADAQKLTVGALRLMRVTSVAMSSRFVQLATALTMGGNGACGVLG